MSFAVYSPDARSVAEVRRLEIGELIRAVEALHVDGVIDHQEYRAKCRALTPDAAIGDRESTPHPRAEAIYTSSGSGSSEG